MGEVDNLSKPLKISGDPEDNYDSGDEGASVATIHDSLVTNNSWTTYAEKHFSSE
jgi:hypothetical protein